MPQRTTPAAQASPPPKATKTRLSPSLKVTGGLGFAEGDRDGGGGGVAVAVEIDPDLVTGEIEAAGGGVDDAEIGLVRDEHVDVGEAQTGLLDGLGGGVAHDANGELEDLVAVHLHVGAVFGEDLGRFGDEGAPTGDVEMLVTGAVGAKDGREQTAWLVRGLDDEGAGAVAEEDAGGAIGVVDKAGEGVGADDEDAIVDTGLDELATGGEGVDETRTGSAEIEGAGIAAEFGLDQACLGDKELVGCAGADDDEVDVIGGRDRRGRGLGGRRRRRGRSSSRWGRRRGAL